MLEASHISVSFRRRDGSLLKALDDVSVTIPDGRTVGLVGESGSGKTTLVRVMCGLLRPDAGAVSVDAAGSAHPVSMVFQDAAGALDPRQRIGDAVAEALRVHGAIPRAHVAQEAARLLRLVGLPDDVAAKRPAELSGGQCQRACIARALAPRPALLIGDEPVSALDVSVQARILRLFADLMRDPASGLRSLFIITHDLAVVSAICDYAYVMERGRIVEEGAPERLFASPSHPYTRRLLAAVPRI